MLIGEDRVRHVSIDANGKDPGIVAVHVALNVRNAVVANVTLKSWMVVAGIVVNVVIVANAATKTRKGSDHVHVIVPNVSVRNVIRSVIVVSGKNANLNFVKAILRSKRNRLMVSFLRFY